MLIPTLADVGGLGAAPLSPEHITLISSSLKVGLAGLGSAVGIGLVGMGACLAVGRNPGAFGRIIAMGLLGMALAEAIIFYALFINVGQ